MVAQYGFYYNVDSCTGCKMCVAACRETKDAFAPGLKFRRVIDYAGGDWKILENGSCVKENFVSYSISMACNHCATPACVETCPTGAMQKDPETGIVWSDSEVCIGCATCTDSCPYGAPRLDEEKLISGKCDFCRDKLANGENPACVDACPMRAIEFGELSELQEKYGTVADLAPLPESSATGPSIVLGTPRLTGEGHVTSTQEELL